MLTYPAEPLGRQARSLLTGHTGAHAHAAQTAEAALDLGDAVDVTPHALGQATQERVQELVVRIARLLLEMETDLLRPLPATGSEGKDPPSIPPRSDYQARLAEVVAHIARLARAAPEAAAQLLARHQATAALFPTGTAQLLQRLGALADPALAQLLMALVQPGITPGPQEIPALLREVLADPAQLAALLKFAARVADEERAGGPRTNLPQGGAGLSPAGDAMDGINAGTLAPRAPGAGTSRIQPQPPRALGPPLVSAGAGVDIVDILSTPSLGGTDAEAAPRINRILGQVLGLDNPLGLSAPPTTGAPAVARPAERSPVEVFAERFAHRLVDLRQRDPESFEKLLTLLRALARLNPGKFDRLLAQVEDQLREATTLQRPAAPDAVPGAAGQAAVAMARPAHTITVTVEVNVHQRLDVIVADLRALGLDARAVQDTSITQIQITLALGQSEQGQRGDPLVIDLQGDGVAPAGRE